MYKSLQCGSLHSCDVFMNKSCFKRVAFSGRPLPVVTTERVGKGRDWDEKAAGDRL